MKLDIDQTEVKVTNIKKIFWPDLKISKGEMIDYYIQIYPYIKKYLYNRPLSLKIYPDGIKGKSFYRKNCPDYAPKWLSTTTLPSGKDKTITWIMANKLSDLVWIANHGTIELHGWFSTIDHPLKPDFAVFDLDPGKKTTFSELIETAKLIKLIIDRLKMVSYVKTSGKRGLHIYIPIKNIYSYKKVKYFLKRIAEIIIESRPDLATIEWRKNKRNGKLNIDYRQNSRGKTLPSPYSLRPTPEATVSTPLDWRELNEDLDLTAFTIQNIQERLEKEGDPWKNILENRQELPSL